MLPSSKKLPWQSARFEHSDDDPLTGFANIMDVMLVFALGLMLALVSQSKTLQQHFKLEKKRVVEKGSELLDSPDIIERMQQGSENGMESLGQVYRDPKSGKLILIGVGNND